MVRCTSISLPPYHLLTSGRWWNVLKKLFLSGYGIDLHVDSDRLIIKDGRDLNKEPSETVLTPKGDDFDSIVIYGHSGNVSLDAMKWLLSRTCH